MSTNSFFLMLKTSFYILLFCYVASSALYAQSADSTVTTQLLSNTFNEFTPAPIYKRPFMQPQTSMLKKLNPLIYISGGLLFLYQNIASEQIQATCTYHISCSENMKLQIKRKGLLAGMLSGLNQLNNCAPSVLNDYPAYKITPNYTINNVEE
jgi:putative component of membrane protein insertase Oxa1/YidC/SpoIIIJ protein YidD